MIHNTAEPSIGALSVFHGLCTIWGFFPSQGFGSPAGRIDQNSYAFLQKKHKLGRSSPDPRLSSYPWASTKVRDINELCSWRGQAMLDSGGSNCFYGEPSAGNSREVNFPLKAELHP